MTILSSSEPLAGLVGDRGPGRPTQFPLQFLSRSPVRRVFAGFTLHHGITCLPVLCLVDRHTKLLSHDHVAKLCEVDGCRVHIGFGRQPSKAEGRRSCALE